MTWDEVLHKAQWHGMKYYIRDVLKPNLPETVKLAEDKITPTEWLLLQLRRRTVLKELYPELLYIVEVIVSLPVSNAWPERGASTLKALRTRLMNRLSTSMLESLLHISINAPDLTSVQGQKLVKLASSLGCRRRIEENCLSTRLLLQKRKPPHQSFKWRMLESKQSQ